ncbi:MAG: hypothetical protein ACJAQT_003531 [Akkermansiaceae bacterium]|jgi:hypothetical protein
MNRREILRKASILSPAIAFPACSTVADLALRQQYLIRTDQILAQLLPFFPFQQNYSGVGQLSLSDPVFTMAPDLNKVRVGLTSHIVAASGLGELTGIPALGRIAGQGTSGTCQLACGLRYDSKSRGLYLKEPAIERFEFDRLSSTLTQPLQQIVNLFGPQFLDQRPIHTLEPSLATRFLNSMEVQPGGIALKFSPLA